VLDTVEKHWEDLLELFEISDKSEPPHGKVSILGPEKCIFIPTIDLIIKMIQAVILLKGKSEKDIEYKFAF
jgi:hypothetical protein